MFFKQKFTNLDELYIPGRVPDPRFDKEFLLLGRVTENAPSFPEG